MCQTLIIIAIKLIVNNIPVTSSPPRASPGATIRVAKKVSSLKAKRKNGMHERTENTLNTADRIIAIRLLSTT
jgi:hypothetical protein